MSDDELIKSLKAIIITNGENGSRLICRDSKNKIHYFNIPVSIPKKEVIDTTGAGDGYRAGFLAGIILNMSILESCYLGSVLASFVIETYGPQTHSCKLKDLKNRYLRTFGYVPQVLEKL